MNEGYTDTTSFHLRLSNYQRNFCDLFPFYSTWQRSLRTLVYYRRVKYLTAHHKSISFSRRRLFVDVEDPIFFTGHHDDRHPKLRDDVTIVLWAT